MAPDNPRATGLLQGLSPHLAVTACRGLHSRFPVWLFQLNPSELRIQTEPSRGPVTRAGAGIKHEQRV